MNNKKQVSIKNEQEKIYHQLAQFLKVFKATSSAQLQMFHSILTKSDTHNLIKKLYNKDYDYDITQPIIFNDETIKLIERFCLRINQFLQYRLGVLKSLKEDFISYQIAVFQRSMKKIFAQVKTYKNFQHFVRKIIDCRNLFAKKILKKLTDIKCYEEIMMVVNEFFNKKLFKNIPIKLENTLYQTFWVTQRSTQKITNPSFKNSLHLFELKSDNSMEKIVDGHFQSTSVFSSEKRSKTQNKQNLPNVNLTQIRFKTRQQYLFGLDKFLNLQTIPKGTYAILIAQLQSLNRKNQVIIEKYALRYKRKHRSMQRIQSKKIKKEKIKKDIKKSSQQLQPLQTKYRTIKPMTKMRKIGFPNEPKPQQKQKHKEQFPTIQKNLINIINWVN